VGSQIGHPNPPLQISAKEEKESENQYSSRRKTYCAATADRSHSRPAMLAVLKYGCASRTRLLPLATVFLDSLKKKYGISETEPEIIACKGSVGAWPCTWLWCVDTQKLPERHRFHESAGALR
jgi:hypothetical protein